MSKFLAGALIGLVAGLLLAPDKGENTRENLASTVDKWREKIDRLVGGGGAGLDELRDYLQQDISGLSADVRNRILTILDEAEEMAYNPNPTPNPVTNGVV
jgi:gas vesicle protein